MIDLSRDDELDRTEHQRKFIDGSSSINQTPKSDFQRSSLMNDYKISIIAAHPTRWDFQRLTQRKNLIELEDGKRFFSSVDYYWRI